MKLTTLPQCMGVLDWFDDPLFEYLNHVLLSKLDGEVRVARVLPDLIIHAEALVRAHTGTVAAYPAEFLNQPA